MAKSRDIYLAGGCFWGVQAYFAGIPGVLDTRCGYANGRVEQPSHSDVSTGRTGAAETVRVTYDPQEIGLDELASRLFGLIDPTWSPSWTADYGTQYRTGVYYVDEADRAILEAIFERERTRHGAPIAAELLPLTSFCEAREEDDLRNRVKCLVPWARKGG